MTRNVWWLIGTLLGWAVLVVGYVADSRGLVGASTVLFVVLLVERIDNLRRTRKARVTR